MTNDTILVLADPAEPTLAKLEKMLAEAGAKTVIGGSAEAFAPAATSARVLFRWSGSLALFKKAFAMCPNLLWVHARSAGLDKILFPELAESSVTLTNGTGVFSAALGEFVLGAILYFAKDFRRMIRNQNAGVWEEFDVLPIAAQTVGIIGYGDIGRAVATKVRAMGMRVLAIKRHASASSAADPLVEQIYSPERRLEMISRSDYVVIASPLTPETKGMVGEQELAAMKPATVIINVGRGPVIKEDALIAALSSRRIAGAALDVFDQEPLPPGHPFYKLENVLLSPHCADHTPDWLDNAIIFFAEQYQRFRDGQPLLNIVDKRLGY